ncbi:MAG: tetratricopeptide repeat protein [Myxococcales bacterium]|nr:tetratricopeptide repeat protein [Myxococcales bacterium]
MTKRLLRIAAAVSAAALFSTVAAERSASAQTNSGGRLGSASPGEQSLLDGRHALDSDDFATAEQKFREAISLDPKLNDAYWRLAAILYGKKQYAQSVELLRRAPDQADIDTREQLGLALYKTANPPPAESIRLLEDVVQKRPDSYAAQLQLGQHLVKSEPKRAAAAIEIYLKYRPPSAASLDPQIHMVLGTAYVYAKEWDLAQREFEGLLKTKPNDMTAKLMLGSVLVGKSSCSQAISLYERILSEAQKQPSIYYNLGTCYLREKRSADALREAELYIKAKPLDAKGHVLTCDALYEQKNYQRALTECQQAERQDQVNGAIKGKVGRIYLGMKNYQSAVTYLEQAVAGQKAAGAGKDPETLGALAEAYAAVHAPKDKLNSIGDDLASLSKDPKALATAGQVYFLAGNDERAMSALNASLTLDANNAGARASLVRVLNRRAGLAVDKGEVGAAYNLLSEAVKLSPDDLMTNRNLGLVLLLSKKYSEAEQVLARSLKKVPNDMVVNRMLARAQLGQHKTTVAQATYEKAAQMALRMRGPDLAAVYAELGPMYADSGQLDQAVSVLETAVKEAGQTPVVTVAQRNLAIAYFKRASAKLRDPKQSDAALDDMVQAAKAPRGALTAKESAAVSCGEAIAALKANKIQQAEDAWDAAIKTGGDNACQFRPPYDKLGTKFFVAYTQYRDAGSPQKREGAVKLFTQLVSRATGGTADWLRALLRSGYELLGYDFYQRSDEKRAGAYLASASKVASKGDKRELEHNLAVVDLFQGKGQQAEKVFDALGARPCEARVNLGILRDRQGESKKALELYKQAKACGARAPKLNEWIDVKERLFGGAQ